VRVAFMVGSPIKPATLISHINWLIISRRPSSGVSGAGFRVTRRVFKMLGLRDALAPLIKMDNIHMCALITQVGVIKVFLITEIIYLHDL